MEKYVINKVSLIISGKKIGSSNGENVLVQNVLKNPLEFFFSLKLPFYLPKLIMHLQRMIDFKLRFGVEK